MQDLWDLNDFSFADLINKDQPWTSLSKIESYIDSKRKELIDKGFKQLNNSLIHPSVSIDKSAIVSGVCIIDEGTEVRDGALIRGAVVIGKNCKVGHASEIKNSILLNKASAGHFNYVGDSIVGSNTNLGAGVVLANLKSGSKNPLVTVVGEHQKFETGLEKLGALIGDKVKIGSNSVTAPGCIIGPNSVVYPLTFVRGTVEKDKIVKMNSNLEITDKE